MQCSPPVAGHVSNPIVLLVVVDLLVQWAEGGDVGVQVLVYEVNLKILILIGFANK